MGNARGKFIWLMLGAAVATPLAFAANSPLLEWRQPIYIAAGFAGIVALGLLLMQPLLAGGVMPGLTLPMSRRVHGIVGLGLVFALLIHVAGLWMTSPPDVIDVFLMRSPTPFAIWGLVAFYGALGSAGLAVLRRRKAISIRFWRLVHTGLVVLVVIGSIIHVVLIEGTMETASKLLLCLLVLVATATVVTKQKAWRLLPRLGLSRSG